MRIFLMLCNRIWPVLPTMLLALLLSWLSTVSSISLMAAAAYLITAAALHPMIYELSIAIVGVRFFGISRAIFRYGERYVSHDATFRIISKLHVWCYEQMETLPVAKLNQWQTTERSTLLTQQIDTLKDFFLRVLAPSITALLVLLTMVFVLWLYHPPAAGVIILAFGAIGIVLPCAIDRFNQQNAASSAQTQQQFTNQCADLISGLADLTVCNALPARLSAIEYTQRAHQAHQANFFRIQALTNTFAELITALTLLFLLALLIPLVNHQQFTGIHLAVLALASQTGLESALALPAAWRYWNDCKCAVQKIYQITISEPPPVAVFKKYAQTFCEPFPLAIEHISFAYDDGHPILKDISFTLNPGTRIAIVGASGAGKSTLLNVLLRLWDCDGGVIRMNGLPYEEIQPDTIRSNFNVVTQHTHLFHLSIKENLRILCPDATDDEILAALDKAELRNFIAALPHGLDTNLGQNGKLFSGGQRQRIALARAFLRPAPILLLDEPTAGLDAITAAKLMQTIEATLSGRAFLLITHQLDGLERMDQILVLHEGIIAECGTFEQLLAKQAIFHRMWMLWKNV